ncbi:YscQ/HrcQ family type III secretion apparatus protein [Xanthomonas hyacinthi]|uniref:YscQ/HrcQ family type III secretion apparatus protein n=1 Tax=Xanthomonas hyacinthi TaxID=56455 RepID=A0A2S7ERC9_9XANT|nr:type III secretion system cytoplasmic ring protein SctQ [Xanthomonas hyacinthi]KLD76401.1 type III secretory pathway component [Xanthomonas hyacinthi DSM 19077]PPU95659.1 YscQ/HrcQ family type III secretion apparatus protein [Xanthomonas hyacinthi]QGY78069.1 YscQ/HrcQ family type III secretion apparatus protein [Xanthomonas hyacinthi]
MSSPAIAAISQLQTRLPHVAPGVARLARLLCSTPLAEAAALSLQRRLHAAGRYARVGLELGDGGRLWLCMDVSADPGLRALLVDTCASASQLALAALLLDAPLAPLQRLGLGQTRLVEFAAWPGALPSACGPALAFGDAQLPLPCVPVEACASAMRALEAAAAAVAAGAAAGTAPPSFRLFAHPCLGQRRYRKQRLASLRPGDVLIAPLQRHRDGYRAWLHCGAATGRQWRLPGRIDRNAFHIEDIAEMSSSNESEPNAVPSAALSVEHVDVPVQLQLDPLVLPLGELGALHPGHVLELNVPVEDACVHLTVYGQSIGSGRLIAIGDQLGLQLVSVNGHAHADA